MIIMLFIINTRRGFTTISIDEVSQIKTTGGLASGSVILKGSDVFYAEESTINIDQDSDLDDSADTYQKNQSHIANSNVNLLSGMTISGSKNDQYGIGQEDYKNSGVTLTNAGDIILTGSGTTGNLYSRYAETAGIHHHAGGHVFCARNEFYRFGRIVAD